MPRRYRQRCCWRRPRANRRWTRWLERRFNAGEYSHGAIAWALAALPLLAGVWLVFVLLDGISPILGWMWDVVVLYFTLGFKYFSDNAAPLTRMQRAAASQR